MFGNKIAEITALYETKVKDLEQALKQSKLDLESEKRILNNELAIKVHESVMELEKTNNKLESENAVQSKEIEILRKAFENMGFDVKDMKDILNKLVDGIVSKNTINVVK
jgi:CII-binding regulator of phage lambda lysogenization HflD